MRDSTTELTKLKVIVIGSENSGKTTLVKQLSPSAKSVEHFCDNGESITVGLDIGKIELAGCALYFFGTPGQQRFEFARKIVSHGAHMGVLMVDSVSAASGTSEREQALEQELIKRDIPYIIVANKRDMPGVAPMSEIRKHFKADVYPIIAKTGEGVEVLTEVLVEVIESNKHSWFSGRAKKVAYG